MSKTTHRDAMLSPEDFAASIEAYKAKKAELTGTQPPTAESAPAKEEIPDNKDVKPDAEPKPVAEPTVAEPVAEPEVKPEEPPAEAKAEKGSEAPKDLEEAMEQIATLTAGLQELQATIDKMQAEKDMTDFKTVPEEQADGGTNPVAEPTAPTEPMAQPIIKKEEEKPMTMDSIDAIVSQKLELGKIGAKLNLDGLETMEIKEAQKKVILAVNPGMRLDGQSDAYIEAAYAFAKDKANEMKTTNDQRQQMANGQRLDGMEDEVKGPSCSAYEARQKLINRRENRE